MSATKKDVLDWLKAEARFGARREDKAAAQVALVEISRMQTMNDALVAALQAQDVLSKKGLLQADHGEIERVAMLRAEALAKATGSAS